MKQFLASMNLQSSESSKVYKKYMQEYTVRMTIHNDMFYI